MLQRKSIALTRKQYHSFLFGQRELYITLVLDASVSYLWNMSGIFVEIVQIKQSRHVLVKYTLVNKREILAGNNFTIKL